VHDHDRTRPAPVGAVYRAKAPGDATHAFLERCVRNPADQVVAVLPDVSMRRIGEQLSSPRRSEAMPRSRGLGRPDWLATSELAARASGSRGEVMVRTVFVAPVRAPTRVFWAIGLSLLLLGCASTPDRQPLPPELTNVATIPGVPRARFWGDEWPRDAVERLKKITPQQIRADHHAVFGRPHAYLAISGGGSNGAFGAGLLAGWSAAGTRPEFTMVTGISTGALIAPFAYLGPDYDERLRTVYTTTRTADIVDQRWIVSAAFGDSMADTRPLRALIARFIGSDVIEAIAREHATGRRLFIGTANLDAGRSVIWDLGAIAASDHPGKADLIHDVLQASSAIPVAFPPVVISVDANGARYDEMHVDGGTASQVFVYPAAVDWKRITEKLEVPGVPRVFVIRNGFLEPDYQGVTRSLLPIAERSIDSLIRTQGIGDLYQIYALCQRDGNDFHLAYIPSDFTEAPSENFDPVYMGKLFDLGFELAKNGYPWKKVPPGFEVTR
jgi:predicted acylesterase/phospholipase RssA